MQTGNPRVGEKLFEMVSCQGAGKSHAKTQRGLEIIDHAVDAVLDDRFTKID
jgi:hypothetical protein